ncbi:AraC family transcriptional regulator [Enterococcus nangangensis]|uniref:AraC family transcriptional regulator n=1 Tax=Enterococcus nangangensis TaxID=2559926 RepID=UPI0010FA0CEA|nr:AraC family transcriptional regulator [Enterococcus nangangensis]
MPLYFDLVNRDFPFMLESIGCDWVQVPIKRPDGHPYYHWLQTQSGEGEITIGEVKLSLPKDAGVLIAPFIPHQYAAKGSEPWVTSFVTIKGTFADRISEMMQEENYLYVQKEPQILTWLHGIVDSYEKRSISGTELSVETYRLLLQLTKHLEWQPPLENKLVQTYLKPTIAYIETHFAEDLSVEILAETIFVTPQYLTRLFRRFYGVTASEYLMRLRIKKAKELLLTKKDTEIQVISQLVGFKSSSHFIATFKKLTSYTPIQFRQLYLN